MAHECDNCENTVILFEGESYDVTSYLKDHPGGAEILKGVCGQNVTERILTQEAHRRVLNFIRSKLKQMKMESVTSSKTAGDQVA